MAYAHDSKSKGAAVATAVPTVVAAATAGSWRLGIAFRNVTDQDSLHLRCTATMMQSELVHTDLLLHVQCGGKKCRYKGDYHVGGCENEGKPMHVIAYGIRNLPESHVVKCQVDPEFHKDNGWSFLGIAATPQQLERADAFMRSQLGGGYNAQGFNWNYIGGWCGLAIGTKKIEVLPGVKLKKPRVWFCSELVSAALINCGVISACDLTRDPCTISPEYLSTCIRVRLRVGLSITDVWPESADADHAVDDSSSTNQVALLKSSHSFAVTRH